jgi:hypothetical protein
MPFVVPFRVILDNPVVLLPDQRLHPSASQTSQIHLALFISPGIYAGRILPTPPLS